VGIDNEGELFPFLSRQRDEGREGVEEEEEEEDRMGER